MTKHKGDFLGHAPLTLMVVAFFGCGAGVIAKMIGRGDLFAYAFYPSLLTGFAGFIWHQSRNSKTVVNVKRKRKQFVETVRYKDDRGVEQTRDRYEYWVETDKGNAVVGYMAYQRMQPGGVYEVRAQRVDGELFVSTFPEDQRRSVDFTA